SFALVAQQKNSRSSSSSSSSSSSTSSIPFNRSKFPFTATAALYRKVTPQDLSSLNSQEIVRVAIYVMKRSHLGFADPFTSEKVHTAGEEYSKQYNQDLHPMASSASEIYLSRKFNIGKSVLHNPSYPLRRPLESAISIATFCAKASGGLRSKSSISALPSSPSSVAGAERLAKLGQIIFGGPCSHAGHSHHRRTRASLDLLERQNIELGKKILAEEQQRERKKLSGGIRPHSIHTMSGNTSLQAFSGKQSFTDFYPLTNSEILAARGSEQGSTLSRSTSTSTLSVTSNYSTADKWCKHCSRAVACLVLVAQQEASKTGEDEYVFDDTGFGTGSGLSFENLDIHSPNSSMQSSPSTPQFDSRPRLRSKSDERSDRSVPNASPYIIFDRSYEQHDEGVFPVPTPPDQSSNTNPSQQRNASSLEKSLADAFGSEFATDSLRKEKAAPLIPRLVSHSNSNNSNNSRTHSPSLGSDVELVSRTTSTMSLSSSFGQGNSHTGASSSPRPVLAQPLFMSPSFSPSPPKSLLERDLAEAIATDARLPFTGSLASRRRLSSDLGLHPKPNLDSVRESVSRSNSERSSFSSAKSAGGSPGEVQKAAIEHDRGKDRKVGETDDNLANVSESEMAKDTSAKMQDRDKEVTLEGTIDENNNDKEGSPMLKQPMPRPRSASPDSSLASSPLSQNTADEFITENASHHSPSTSAHETSPSLSPIATSPSRQSLGQDIDQVTKEPERIHHPFYALGIHGQTPTDAYATEIEEAIQKGNKASPPSTPDSNDEDNSSASSQQDSPVFKELSEGSDREKVENDELSNPDQHANEVEVTPSLSPDKEITPESNGSSPRSTGSLAISGNEDDDQGSQDDSLEDQDDDEENDRFDLHSPVSIKSSTSTLRPMSSISSISLTDDYLTTGSSEDDANTDHPPRPSDALEGNASSLSALTQEQRRALEKQKRRRHRRQQLVDDAKRKQEQLDRIKAQLELKRLGKIRQQVSFWEEKGVLEQRVVSVEEVEAEVPDLDDD
ncbi:hypothetical protein BGZ93_006866, partial [Podila epicladia]